MKLSVTVKNFILIVIFEMIYTFYSTARHRPKKMWHDTTIKTATQVKLHFKFHHFLQKKKIINNFRLNIRDSVLVSKERLDVVKG